MYFLRPKYLRFFNTNVIQKLNIIFFATLSVAMYITFKFQNEDQLHGHLLKILYIHVPTAWLSISIYASMGVSALLSIILNSPFYKIVSEALCLPGIILTTLCLITGCIWGKPAWGAWWVWDARLTSMAILLFFYAFYFIIFIDQNNHNKFSLYVCVLGMVNLPIIKWSVNWWFTLHQPASINLLSKNTLHPKLWPPLIAWLLTFLCWVIIITVNYYFKRKARYIAQNKIRTA